ncbi:MAG: hypothetical protein KKA05_12545 [Alphaproteobacteria bacterium]|nr:hypothetical protein [Alphaproteobacteria bacterium]
MSLYKQFATNTDKEIEGIEVQMTEAENDDGSVPTFVVSRMGKSNKRYSKALEAATRPYRRQIELGTMNNDKAEEIFLGVFVDTVLKGWKNVRDESGADMPFTKQTATKLFKDLPEVYERLQEEAKLSANFREASLEEEAKN